MAKVRRVIVGAEKSPFVAAAPQVSGPVRILWAGASERRPAHQIVVVDPVDRRVLRDLLEQEGRGEALQPLAEQQHALRLVRVGFAVLHSKRFFASFGLALGNTPAAVVVRSSDLGSQTLGGLSLLVLYREKIRA